jgi:nucleotide-binding universal stress UspA family protein
VNIPQVHIKKILYTTDLSDSALKAFAYAVSLANQFKAGLIILHVMADYQDIESKIASYIGKENVARLKEDNVKEVWQTLSGKRRDNVIIKDALSFISSNAGKEWDFETDEVLVLKGDAVEQIINVSREYNCDLIVMGTHGHGPVGEMLGSTARKVLRHSQVPVLTVRLDD